MSQVKRDVAGTVFEDTAPELTRTYAEALIGAAGKAGPVEAVLDELDELTADVWEARPEFAALIASPVHPAGEKDRVLLEAFQGRSSPILLNFLRVLNRHGRIGLLPAIARRARADWDRRMNRRPVVVRSAVPLDEGEQAALRDRLAALLQATPILRLEVDPELIGGLVIQTGDHVYDASVRNQYLDQFRRRLLDQKLHEILSRSESFLDPS